MNQTQQRREAASFVPARGLASKSLPEHNRRNNRALVLQHLFHTGPMSRADLARESGLTRVTIGDLVAELTGEGVVHEVGQRAGARPGKPATLVEIDADAAHIVALDLSPADGFVGVVMNLRGEVQHRLVQQLASAMGESAIEKVLQLVAGLLHAAQRPVLGIGVGTPGIVDHAGVVRQAPNLGWYDIDLGARIRRVFDHPVYVANDANAAVLAVRTFGGAPGTSAMVVRIEHGVGAGLVIGGALVEGEQYAAGEIGHVVVHENGERCACGRRGCLELAVAAPHIRRRLEAAGEDAREQVLTEAGHALGVAMSPVISMLNLNHVVLSGPADLIGGALIERARQTIRERTMSAVSNGLEVRAASGDEDLALMGAGVLVLSGELGVS
jgi:predicted NBD/HSP70 family sugar kinase